MTTIFWGVDSADKADEKLYQCVLQNFGQPSYWGRYLTSVPNVSDGLTPEEIYFLHLRGIKIIPIYNDFRKSFGYRNGQVTARNAIFQASRLKCPKNVVLFANIEHFYEIDADWIRGWVDVIYGSGYRSGIYFDPKKGIFSQAYCEAIRESDRVKEQLILWSAEPEFGTTKKKDAPKKFTPATPHCISTVCGWQYGRDAPTCPIDTNLIDQHMFNLLW